MNDIATICMRARDLILRDGWQAGGDGWRGYGGWCIEGALGQAMGIVADPTLSLRVNRTPVAEAIRCHIGMPGMWSLHVWNDRICEKEKVLRVLAEVAAAYTEQEPVEEVRVLPPMPETIPTEVQRFRNLIGV